MKLELKPLQGSEPIEGDPFGNSAAKLAILLGIESHERVLVIAPGGHPWKDELAAHFPACVIAEEGWTPEGVAALGRGSFALVLLAIDGQLLRQDLQRLVSDLRPLLRERGSLILAAKNRFGLRRMRRAPRSLLSQAHQSRFGYRATLRNAGFGAIAEFLPLPDGGVAEELVSSDAEIALPAYASRIEKRLAAMGAYPFFSDDFLYIASAGESPFLPLLEELSACGDDSSPDNPGPSSLERFALRPRGALILVLRERDNGRRTICRITGGAQVDRVIRENLRWTEWIHAFPHLPAATRRLIPLPLGCRNIQGNRAYLEEMLQGVIAWKLAVDRGVEPVLFAEMNEFLRQLDLTTVEKRQLPAQALDELLPRPGHEWLEPEFVSLLSDLRAQLVRQTVDRWDTFTLSHGDFGYGNTLADPRTAKITGVIDWDQGRMDLRGVDLVNFLVQRQRMLERVPLTSALATVGDAIISGGFPSVDPRLDYARDWARERRQRALLLGWAVWRYVERDARYRRGYLRDRLQLSECLRWAIGAVTS